MSLQQASKLVQHSLSVAHVVTHAPLLQVSAGAQLGCPLSGEPEIGEHVPILPARLHA